MDHKYFEVQYGGKVKDIEGKPEEFTIFGIICSMFESLGRNPNELDLERYSNNYLTIKLGEWDLVRYLWGPRSKWVRFPTVEMSKIKHKIKAPEDVEQFSELLQKSVEHIEKYS